MWGKESQEPKMFIWSPAMKTYFYKLQVHSELLVNIKQTFMVKYKAVIVICILTSFRFIFYF